jgi:polysaccharide biosynthesis/export protein
MMLRRLVVLLLPMVLTACATFPSSGPTTSQIGQPLFTGNVAVRDITPELVAAMPIASPASQTGWALSDAPPAWEGIAVGDTIGISIFEMGYGLFTPGGGVADSGVAPVAPRASGRNFPPIIVSESGLIDLPYIGSLRVSGLTPAAVTKEIERRMRGKSQFAQALVTLERGSARSVILSGDVKQPGRLLLTASGERLLDAVALAGGPSERSADTLVRLTRAGGTSDIRLDLLRPGDPANVRLGAGDRIELIRNVRSFTVLGAAKTVSEIAFDSDRLTLIEALSRAGGPEGEKADPTGVFVFRYEVEKTGEVPVIYRLNLLNPQSYFAAQRFAMREKDVMLIANSKTNQIGKIIQMLNGFTAPAVLLDVVTR